MASFPSVHSTAARPRLAAFAVLATAAATALAALGSLPVMAQPAPQAPASTTAPADAQSAPARPLHLRAAPQREQIQQHQQTREQRVERMERWQQRRAERMAAFKTQLQVTPAQEQAWTDFTAAMQPGQRHARLGREGMDNLTTPERIDRMRALRIQRAAEADQRGDAVKTFYAALNAPQQKTFDQQMRQMQKRMSQGHEGGPGAKHQRSGSQAGGPGARAAKHQGGHDHHGVQQRRAGAEAAAAATGNAPSAAVLPAAPAASAQ